MSCGCEAKRTLNRVYPQKAAILIAEFQRLTDAKDLLGHMAFEEKYVVPWIDPGAADNILRAHRAFRKYIELGIDIPKAVSEAHAAYESAVFT